MDKKQAYILKRLKEDEESGMWNTRELHASIIMRIKEVARWGYATRTNGIWFITERGREMLERYNKEKEK